jgi:hypothetical protein
VPRLRVLSRQRRRARRRQIEVAGGARDMRVKVKKAGKLKHSSQLWLERQLNDPYVKRARELGYRSRAAFKIEEMDDRYKFLKTDSADRSRLRARRLVPDRGQAHRPRTGQGPHRRHRPAPGRSDPRRRPDRDGLHGRRGPCPPDRTPRRPRRWRKRFQSVGISHRKAPSSRATAGRPGIHSGAPTGGAPEWIPDLRFAASGMTAHLRGQISRRRRRRPQHSRRSAR